MKILTRFTFLCHICGYSTTKHSSKKFIVRSTPWSGFPFRVDMTHVGCFFSRVCPFHGDGQLIKYEDDEIIVEEVIA